MKVYIIGTEYEAILGVSLSEADAIGFAEKLAKAEKYKERLFVYEYKTDLTGGVTDYTTIFTTNVKSTSWISVIEEDKSDD